MADQQQKLQSLSEQYQKLQQDLQNYVQTRQKLESQQQENLGVQKEFASLKDDANIYKLIGPVLLKQEKTEAVMAVDGRLDFIGKEIKRIETQIKEVQGQTEKVKMEIMQIQSAPSEQAAGQTQAVT